MAGFKAELWTQVRNKLGITAQYEDVYSPMKAAQQEHKHTDRNTNVKDRQRTELSKKYKNQDTRL